MSACATGGRATHGCAQEGSGWLDPMKCRNRAQPASTIEGKAGENDKVATCYAKVYKGHRFNSGIVQKGVVPWKFANRTRLTTTAPGGRAKSKSFPPSLAARSGI